MSIIGSFIQQEESANFPEPSIPNPPSRKYLSYPKHFRLVYSNHFTKLRISKHSNNPKIHQTSEFTILRKSSRMSTAASEGLDDQIAKLMERNERYVSKVRTSIIT